VTAGVFHQEAAAGRWFEMPLVAQLGNVGTEVARAARAKEAGNEARAWNAFVRTLELFDLTIADERWRGPKRREICRAREAVWTSLQATTNTARLPSPWIATSCLSQSPPAIAMPCSRAMIVLSAMQRRGSSSLCDPTTGRALDGTVPGSYSWK